MIDNGINSPSGINRGEQYGMDDRNKNNGGKGPGSAQIFAIILIAGLITLLSVMAMSSYWGQKASVPYTEFVRQLEAGNVDSVRVDSSSIYYNLKPGAEGYNPLSDYVTVRMESGDQLTQRLIDAGVTSEQMRQNTTRWSIRRYVLIFGILVLFMHLI